MKLACITGDVHHDLGNLTWDSQEEEFALEYARILRKQGAKGTVFVTGKCARHSTSTIREIAEMDCMEVGGHTYQAFKLAPTILPSIRPPVRYKGQTWNVDLRAFHHYLFWAIWGSFYGPLSYQKWNIGRTIRALSEANVRPVSWRTHGYDSDSRTFAALDYHDLWQATITGPTDEMVDPGSDNEKYRDQFFRHVNEAAKRSEPVLFQMHPKRQAMIEFDHLEETIDVLTDKGYEFVTISELVTRLTGETHVI